MLFFLFSAYLVYFYYGSVGFRIVILGDQEVERKTVSSLYTTDLIFTWMLNKLTIYTFSFSVLHCLLLSSAVLPLNQKVEVPTAFMLLENERHETD